MYYIGMKYIYFMSAITGKLNPRNEHIFTNFEKMYEKKKKS